MISSLIVLLTAFSSFAYGDFYRPQILISEDSIKWTVRIAAALEPQLQELATMKVLTAQLPEKWSILITEKLPGTAGFHSTASRDPQGNPMLMLSPIELVLNGNSGLLAHETFHLVHSLKHPHEVAWMKEGLALLIEALVTGHPIAEIQSAFAQPRVSLSRNIDWRETNPSQVINRTSQYANLQLLFLYAHRYCGGWLLFQSLAFSKLTKPLIGTKLFDRALAEVKPELEAAGLWKPYCENLARLHEKFQTIKYWPRFDSEDGFLLFDPNMVGRILESPPKNIPPFSAVAFARTSSDCPNNSRPLGPSLCLIVNDP